jgi:hypothetical protein
MDLNDYLHTQDQQPSNPQEKEVALIKYTFIAACALKAIAELVLLLLGIYGGLGVLLSAAAFVLFIFSIYNISKLTASRSLLRNAAIAFAAIFIGVLLFIFLAGGIIAHILLALGLLASFAFFFRFYQELGDSSAVSLFFYCFVLLVLSALATAFLARFSVPAAALINLATLALNAYAMFSVTNFAHSYRDYGLRGKF